MRGGASGAESDPTGLGIRLEAVWDGTLGVAGFGCNPDPQARSRG